MRHPSTSRKAMFISSHAEMRMPLRKRARSTLAAWARQQDRPSFILRQKRLLTFGAIAWKKIQLPWNIVRTIRDGGS